MTTKLLKSIKNVSLDEEVLNSKDFRDFFCNDWPAASTALHQLSLVVKNDIVKLLFNIASNVGDGIYDKTCSPDVTE